MNTLTKYEHHDGTIFFFNVYELNNGYTWDILDINENIVASADKIFTNREICSENANNWFKKLPPQQAIHQEY